MVTLCCALQALLGDHAGLDPLVGLYAKACRYCLWPHDSIPRTQKGAEIILENMNDHYSTKGQIGHSNELGSFFQQHHCKVKVHVCLSGEYVCDIFERGEYSF